MDACGVKLGAVWLGLLGAAVAAGCAAPPAEDEYSAADPGTRLGAIATAMRAGDQGAVPELVESLSAADPAVRLAAIAALRQLTGETRGYDYAGPPLERARAVDRWEAWLAAGGRGAKTSPDGSGAPPDGPAEGGPAVNAPAAGSRSHGGAAAGVRVASR